MTMDISFNARRSSRLHLNWVEVWTFLLAELSVFSDIGLLLTLVEEISLKHTLKFHKEYEWLETEDVLSYSLWDISSVQNQFIYILFAYLIHWMESRFSTIMLLPLHTWDLNKMLENSSLISQIFNFCMKFVPHSVFDRWETRCSIAWV